MTRILPALLFSLALLPQAAAQLTEDPTTWTYEAKKTGEGKYNLIFRLALKDGWHIWSMKPGGDGFQIPPSFDFNKSAGVKLVGSVRESGSQKHTERMEGVDGDVVYYSAEVAYEQAVVARGKATITGSHRYQVCNDQMCLPPKTREFSLHLP